MNQLWPRLSAVAAIALASTAPAQCYRWETHPTGARHSYTLDMVYDSARGVVVAFWQEAGQTWEWTPQDGWMTRDVPGPAPRGGSSAAMTYDSTREVVVLHGGSTYQQGTSLDETWEYDGVAWTNRQITGPGGRVEHALAYDPVRERIVLTGGLRDWGDDRVPLGETWEFDGTAWELVSTTGPELWSHAVVFSTQEEMVVVAGGHGADGHQETWGWDGAAWRVLATDGPGGRPHASLTPMPDGSLLLLGGWLWSRSDPWPTTAQEMWRFQNRSWQQLPLVDGPTGLVGHGAAYHPGMDQLLVMHGHWSSPGGGHAVDEMWGWGSDGWTFISGTPEPYGALIAVPWRDEVLYWSMNAWGADAWWWDGQRWSLERGGVPQEGVPYVALDTARNVVVAYLHNGETWEMDETGWTHRASTGPSPRSDVQVVYDPIRNVTVLFGGTADYRSWFNDTWEWDGSEWREHEPATVWDQPESSRGASMAFDQARGVTLLAQKLPRDATWEYDGEWRQAASWAPSAPIAHDPISSRVVAFAGRVWAFDGTRWIDEGAVEDWGFDWPPVDGHAMTFDPHRRRFWIYPVSNEFGQQRTVGSILVRSADHDRNGHTDVFDLLAYLTDWFTGADGADLNGDGRADIIDLLDHLDAWFEGC